MVKHATLDTSAPHFAAMADRLLSEGGTIYRPWRQNWGATSHLERVYGDRASIRVVKHTTLGTSVPHFAAMADRLLSQSAQAICHGGKARVLPRIWHVFMEGSPSARAVKHVALDTSAPHFVAMADRWGALWQLSIGHGCKARGQTVQSDVFHPAREWWPPHKHVPNAR